MAWTSQSEAIHIGLDYHPRALVDGLQLLMFVGGYYKTLGIDGLDSWMRQQNQDPCMNSLDEPFVGHYSGCSDGHLNVQAKEYVYLVD